ncbi:hypothetical protein PHMEG_00016424 [Phytophthora megakarya]|uniref:Uncharacterized protein n=1 Tax=Phytophthora megakarya TaxID=4795 RepID=A0A225W1H2_9STRA|nr:hypothetical protein PHMEG_00016424 [Phytophthora megakarya]
MSLGPSGAAMLEAISKIRRPSPATSGSQPIGSTLADHDTITETLQKFFNAVMDRFVAEQQAAGADPVVTESENTRSRDVELEPIRLSDCGSN